MVYNSDIGKYNYNSNNYQIQDIQFNTNGSKLIQDRGFHEIRFNSYKQATEIYLAGKDRISFDFNPFKSRSIAYFGSEATDKGSRPYRKYYSSDNAIEITKKDGVFKVVSYVDGDPYTSSYIKVDEFNTVSTNNKSNYYYLHRDYQGSIIAISNTKGNIVEKRLFDAWGNIKQVVHENGTINKTLGIIDRGYTGHEHLQSVGLIHMNGRLYDSAIRRFLSPDNFVQDPYNTQNFDRYTYVYNNPLMYTDPSGELGFFAVVAIGAAISVGANAINNLMQGIPIWYGVGKSAVMGAVSGAISFGIGTVATKIGSGVLKASFQAVAHGLSGSIISGIDGGNGGSGMLSGMISSLISSAVQGLGNINWNTDRGLDALGLGRYLDDNLMDVLTVAAGTLSGGISGSVSGGNFWHGARQGAITSGLNHIVNHIKNNNLEDPIKKAHRLEKEYRQLEKQNLAKSIISEVILEYTDSGDIVKEVRKKAVGLYGDDNLKQAYELLDTVNDKLGPIVDKLKQFKIKNKSVDFFLYRTSFALMASAMEDYVKMEWRSLRIKHLDLDTYYRINPGEKPIDYKPKGFFKGGSFGGGGASGQASGHF